jgi:hypothetical protein
VPLPSHCDIVFNTEFYIGWQWWVIHAEAKALICDRHDRHNGGPCLPILVLVDAVVSRYSYTISISIGIDIKSISIPYLV